MALDLIITSYSLISFAYDVLVWLDILYQICFNDKAN